MDCFGVWHVCFRALVGDWVRLLHAMNSLCSLRVPYRVLLEN